MCSNLNEFFFSFIASSEDILPWKRETSLGFASLSSCKQKVENRCESDTVNFKEYGWIRDIGTQREFCMYYIWSTAKEMIPATVAIHARARNFVAHDALLLTRPASVLHGSLARCTLLEMLDVFQTVCSGRTVYCSRQWQSITRPYSQHLPHRARHAHCHRISSPCLPSIRVCWKVA